MFEQATLTGGPLSTRLWSTCAGVTGQVFLLGATLLVPLIWPAALPPIQSYISIVAPGPPAPPPPPPAHDAAIRSRVAPRPFQSDVFTMPPRVPDRVAHVVEEPPELVATAARNGVRGGMEGGIEDGLVGSITASARAAAPPPQARVVDRSPQPAPAPAAEAPPIRVPVGGRVQLGAPIHRVEPAYPLMAQTTRVEGVVQIEAVVGVDGRIRELRAKSGHPFLITAALDAVRQWIYTPTLLNGKPVEVVAPITVTFRLGGR